MTVADLLKLKIEETQKELNELQLLLSNVSDCSCSSKILPDGDIQFSLCRKCRIEMSDKKSQ